MAPISLSSMGLDLPVTPCLFCTQSPGDMFAEIDLTQTYRGESMLSLKLFLCSSLGLSCILIRFLPMHVGHLENTSSMNCIIPFSADICTI